MDRVIWMRADELHPSQFYINEEKLTYLKENFDQKLMDPIPVKKLDNEFVITDGHTRICYLVGMGHERIPTIEEDSDLNWDAYRINVKDCTERGIHSALDLGNCIVSSEQFNLEWNQYCDAVHDSFRPFENVSL